jgi:type VI secretion system protein ImpA
MASIPIDKLLQPVSAEQPCGVPLDDDMELGNLWREIETEAKGKPEQQFGDTIIEAKPGDWKQIQGNCLQLLERSRHLGPAVYLTAAALEMNGIPGLRDGLKLIHGLVEGFWTSLHPLPDPDEPEDFYERQGILEMMTMDYLETPADTLRFVERVRKAPLAQSRQAGRVAYADILAFRTAAAAAPTRELIGAAFADTSPELLESVQTAASESAELIKSLQQRLNEGMGRDAPNFSSLIREIDGVVDAIAEFTGAAEPADAAESAADGSSAGPATGGAAAQAAPSAAAAAAPYTPGVIQSRNDAIRAINSIIAYYRANEPASPVPLLLERAKKLVNNDFLGIIRNFRPDLERDFLAILGVADYEEGGMEDRPQVPPAPPPQAPRPPAPAPQAEADDPWKNVKI